LTRRLHRTRTISYSLSQSINQSINQNSFVHGAVCRERFRGALGNIMIDKCTKQSNASQLLMLSARNRNFHHSCNSNGIHHFMVTIPNSCTL